MPQELSQLVRHPKIVPSWEPPAECHMHPWGPPLCPLLIVVLPGPPHPPPACPLPTSRFVCLTAGSVLPIVCCILAHPRWGPRGRECPLKQSHLMGAGWGCL